MQKLTGYQRFTLTRIWVRGDKELDKETYIKKVCEAKGIEYVAPLEINRAIVPTANMFPVKK